MAGLLSMIQKKKQQPQICSAVVVAAGSARRMEGIDKILAPLGELPVLVHTLMALEDCPLIHEIVVVTREDLLVEVSRLCRGYALNKVTKVVKGGSERALSVQAGLSEVRQDAALIAIQDGARPLLTRTILEQTISAAAKTGAAAPAVPVTDTLKQVKDGLSEGSVDRSQLWAVQTPQVFDADLIRAATAKVLSDGELLTDDCAAVERLGMKVTMIAGSKENIKITTPFDLLLGQVILEARVKGGFT